MTFSDSLKQPRLAVIQLGRLGDVVQSTLALKALHKQNPNAHLSLIAFKPFVEVVAHWPVIDEIIALDQSEWSRMTRPNAWDSATYAPVVKAFAQKLDKFDRVYNLTFNELASLANILTEHPKVRIVFVGTEEEKPLVVQIISLMKDKQRAINLTGQTQLSQLADVIRQVRLVVGKNGKKILSRN